MNKENLEGAATEQEQAAKVTSESELAAEAVAAAIHSVSPGSRQYFMGFLSGLQAAEEVKKAG